MVSPLFLLVSGGSIMEKSIYQKHAEVLTRLSNHLDLTGKNIDRMLFTINETIAHTLDLEQVSTWEFSHGMNTVSCTAFFSRFNLEKPAVPVDLTLNKAYINSLHTEYAIASSDIEADIRVGGLPAAYWIDPKIKSYLHIPVRIASKVVGILRMDMRSVRTWSEEDIQFCVHAASMITQTILGKEIVLRDERISKFKALSTNLTYRFELPNLLNDLVRRSVEMLNGSYGAIFLTDAESRMIYSAAGYNLPARHENISFHYGQHVAGQVAETGQELLIRDYRSWPGRTEDLSGDEPLTSILSIPMRIHGDVMGVLQVTRRENESPFMEYDRENLTCMANLTCLAVEQNKLNLSNFRLNKFQDAMLQILENTTLASSTRDFLETTIDHISQALNVGHTLIYIEGENSSRGFPDDTWRQIDNVMRKRGIRYNPAAVSSDVTANDGGFPEFSELMIRMDYRAFILVPISLNKERVGFTVLAVKTPRTWSTEEIKMVEITSNQISLAVEGIRFYQESRLQNENARRMAGVTNSLNRFVTVDDMISLIGEGAVHLFGSDDLALVLREKNDQVSLSWSFGLYKDDLAPVVSNEGRDLLKMFSIDKEPVLVTNIPRSTLPLMVKNYMVNHHVKNVKAAPILFAGNVIGVILGMHEETIIWTEKDMQLCMSFCNTSAMALQNTWSYAQLEKGYLELAVTLTDALESRESQARFSSLRVAEWAERTGNLIGVLPDTIENMRWAALMHDIGKVDVPIEVLKKIGPLSAEEKKKLQTYPIKSEKMMAPMSHYRQVGLILRGIREHYDGSGYPDQLKGDAIPLASRILSVADAYSSLIDGRPYRLARSHEGALEEIRKNSGSQFDPQVVDAFMQTVSDRRDTRTADAHSNGKTR